MGVTIHFQGSLRGEGAYLALLEQVLTISSQRCWPTEQLAEAERSLKRVRDEEPWDYIGLTKGLVVHPHENAEPLRFEFDENFYVQEYCKTQFAGPAVHVAIVELLGSLRPLFETLTVEDEGEYWDTSDESVLVGHMQWIDAQIARLVAEQPSRKAAVRLPSLRIADVIG